MSLRERALHWGRRPAFNGKSSISEKLSSLAFKLLHPKEKQRVIIVRRSELKENRPPKPPEPTYRPGMSDEDIWGSSISDLKSAGEAGALVYGDSLRIISEYIDFDRNRPVHEVDEKMFAGLLDGQPVLLDPLSKETENFPNDTTFPEDVIVNWRKLRGGNEEEKNYARDYMEFMNSYIPRTK